MIIPVSCAIAFFQRGAFYFPPALLLLPAGDL
jgi:hypothetical protein